MRGLAAALKEAGLRRDYGLSAHQDSFGLRCGILGRLKQSAIKRFTAVALIRRGGRYCIVAHHIADMGGARTALPLKGVAWHALAHDIGAIRKGIVTSRAIETASALQAAVDGDGVCCGVGAVPDRIEHTAGKQQVGLDIVRVTGYARHGSKAKHIRSKASRQSVYPNEIVDAYHGACCGVGLPPSRGDVDEVLQLNGQVVAAFLKGGGQRGIIEQGGVARQAGGVSFARARLPEKVILGARLHIAQDALGSISEAIQRAIATARQVWPGGAGLAHDVCEGRVCFYAHTIE